MKHKQFTLTYYEGEEMQAQPSEEGYDTIAEAVVFCHENKLPYSVFLITEWDLKTIDAYGVPEIIAQVCLQHAVDDLVKDLRNYVIY